LFRANRFLKGLVAPMPASARARSAAPPAYVARVRLVPRFGAPPPPRSGRARIAYYGLGYYVGLVAIGLAAFACLMQWDQDHLGPARFHLELNTTWHYLSNEYILTNFLLAFNGAVWSLLDVRGGKVKSPLGFWLNVFVICVGLVWPVCAKARPC